MFMLTKGDNIKWEYIWEGANNCKIFCVNTQEAYNRGALWAGALWAGFYSKNTSTIVPNLSGAFRNNEITQARWGLSTRYVFSFNYHLDVHVIDWRECKECLARAHNYIGQYDNLKKNSYHVNSSLDQLPNVTYHLPNWHIVDLVYIIL